MLCRLVRFTRLAVLLGATSLFNPTVSRAAEIFVLSSTFPLRFEDLYSTGRQAALSYSDLASAEGMGGLWTNPGAPLASGEVVDVCAARAGDLPGRPGSDIVAVGGSAQWKFIRVAVASRGYSDEEEAFSVAPGPAPTFDYSWRDTALGTTIDVGRLVHLEERFGVSLGAGWRHRAEEFSGTQDSSSEVSTDSIDLGASGTWRDRFGSTESGIALSAVFLNALGGHYELSGRPRAERVRTLRVGTTLSLALDSEEGGRVPLEAHAATAVTRQFGDVDRTTWHVGGEIVVASHVFLRGGRESLTSESTWSYGAGLRYALNNGIAPLDGIAVAFDWTRQDFDLSGTERSIDTLGARLSVEF